MIEAFAAVDKSGHSTGTRMGARPSEVVLPRLLPYSKSSCLLADDPSRLPPRGFDETACSSLPDPGSALFALASPALSAEAPVDYNRDVRPILAKNCFACHGQDDGHRAAKLRLDRRETALLPRKRGAAIVPGAADKSLLIQRVTTEDEDETHAAHAERQFADGTADRHAQTLDRPGARRMPSIGRSSNRSARRCRLSQDRAWPRNGIDFFVLARLEKQGLKPAAEADRYALLRRLSFDLRGLPPTPREIDEFLRDRSPDAYEKAVDRFLNDPAYGERWARMWLDLARYADSAGYGSDPLRPNIWRYRDWVIDAFNRNLPYDHFTIEQLAGDLLPHADAASSASPRRFIATP